MLTHMAPPVVLLASLLLLLLLTCNRATADCEPVTCGNLTVEYPFWLGAPSQSPPDPNCGHPAFELWCTGNGSSASVRGSAIHVLRIDYAASSFVASHTRVATGDDGICRTDLNMSSSLALSPFRISATNRALCFLYNCNGTEPHGREYVNATNVPSCGRSIFAYLGRGYDRDTPPAIPTGECTYAYLPVLGSEAVTMTAANYSKLLKVGFLLEWSGTGVGDCSACSASGGQCRYSSESGALACLCSGDKKNGSPCVGKLIALRSVEHTQSIAPHMSRLVPWVLLNYLYSSKIIAQPDIAQIVD